MRSASVLPGTFGAGVIMKSTLTRTDEELVIRFEGAGMKIINATYAQLTKR